MVTGYLMHFAGIATAIAASGLSSGYAQSHATKESFMALRSQIAARDAITKNLFVGLVMIESAGILAILFAFIFFFGFQVPETVQQGVVSGALGFGCALATAAVTWALGSPVKSAVASTARQPFFASKIMILMIIIQSTITVPLIFAFVVALIIKNCLACPITTYEAVKLCASMAVVSFGAFGPSIGQYFFGDAVCRAVGYAKSAYDRLFMYVFLTAAVVETPFIFALIVSIIMIYKPISATGPWVTVAASLSAAFCMIAGTIAASSAVGFIASKAAHNTGHDAANYPLWTRTALLAQVFVETTAIYALLVSLLLLIKVE